MDFLQIGEKIFLEFAQQALPSSVLEQIANGFVHSVELSPCGLFVNLTSDSGERFEDGSGPEDVSIIRTLVDHEEIADAILHFKDGIIYYLEIQLYDSSVGLGRLANAHLA